MSRFSTISSQHSALRDIERQRLERKMGQLRREVEGCDQVGAKGIGQRDERRFKPPRRRQHPPRCNSETGQHNTHSTLPDAGQHSARSDETWRPGPGPDVLGGERAQSVEIAWLWNASNRMDEDAQQVAAFLTKHGLDRYAALLADEPSGLGASLESLSQADDAQLEKAGVPASPRARLLTALEGEAAASALAASPNAATRPRSTASAPGDFPKPAPVSSQLSEPRKWGNLGRVPPGWSRVTGSSHGLSSRVVETADAATGGDDCDDGGEVQNTAVAATPQPSLPRPPVSSPSAGPRRPNSSTLRPTSVASTSVAQVTQLSRPNSAASRPGSSHGSTERVSCYHCYKQVLSKFAVLAEEGHQHFCSEDCATRFEQSLQERRERERQLSELRASLLEGAEADPEDAC